MCVRLCFAFLWVSVLSRTNRDSIVDLVLVLVVVAVLGVTHI